MKRILTTTCLFLGACFLLSAQETGNNRLVIERKWWNAPIPGW